MPLTIKAIERVEAQLKITNELLQKMIDTQQPKKEVVLNTEKPQRGNKNGNPKQSRPTNTRKPVTNGNKQQASKK